MKKTTSLLPILLTCLKSYTLNAQDSSGLTKSPVPAEILIGNNRLFYQIIINKKITKNNKLGYFSTSSFAADYNNEISKNEYLTTALLYCNIFKSLSVNSGATLNTIEGLKPFVGLQYTYTKKNIMFFYLPAYYYLSSQKISNFAFIEYKPGINNHWAGYSKLQVNYIYDIGKNYHFRSYIYSRLGLTYSNLTFGAGANLDWYGETKKLKENYGLFLKLNL